MMQKTICFGFAAIVALGLGGAAQAQNLVSNGGFESVYPPLGTTSSTNYRYLGNENSTTLAPWISTDDGIGERSYVYNTSRYPAYVWEGSNSYTVQQGTSIRQVLMLSEGQYYALTMLLGPYNSVWPSYSLQVSIGTASFEVRNEIAPFVLVKKLFQASGTGSVELKFRNTQPPPDHKNYLIDDVRIELAQRVNGNAYLSGYLASVVGELLAVEVLQDGSLVETLDGNYGPNGTFAFSPTVSGAAVLKFRFRTGLWKAVPVTLGPTPIENLTVNMTNGDCDHDNEVGIGDYALLSSTYGLSVGDPGFDTNADLNGDTTVDIADYAILSGSYGEVGD